MIGIDSIIIMLIVGAVVLNVGTFVAPVVGGVGGVLVVFGAVVLARDTVKA